MNKMLFVVVAAVAICLSVSVLRPPSGRAAGADEDDTVVGAVTQVDLGPIINRMQAMEAKIEMLNDSIDRMSKAVEEARTSRLLMLDAIQKLSPMKWEYKVVRTLNENAVQAPGLDGWEMVAITDQGWVYFKRPLIEDEQ